MTELRPVRTRLDVPLQRVRPASAGVPRALLWRGEPGAHGRTPTEGADGVAIPDGAAAAFDTYFAAFFEQHCRSHTRLDRLVLRVAARGPCRVQLWRRSVLGDRMLLEQPHPGTGAQDIEVPTEPVASRHGGYLWFRVVAEGGQARFEGATGIARDAEAARVALAAVICTFNREREVAAMLRALAGEDGPARIIVVSQGRPGRAEAVRPEAAACGDRLRIVEQGNFGGAGGFTRGLLEALADPEITHAVLLDDDVVLSPEALPRMEALFRIARADVPIGGHMLDLMQPTRLYEAGARIHPHNWAFLPQHHMLDLADPGALVALSHPHPVHYSGWWCLGLPLSVVREAGLPLPCFIRGDDMEYGIRLHQAGIPTVPFPGIGVWHEPFYVRLGGWQIYYETRNILIAASLHFGLGSAGMVVRMTRHFLIHLLSYRYYSAALILRGIADFLRGPEVLAGDPAALHAGLEAARATHPPETVPRLLVLPRAQPAVLPRGRLGYGRALLRALWRNWWRPTQPPAPHIMPVQEFSWVAVTASDHIALDTGWEAHLPAFRRRREVFRAQAKEAARLLWRLGREGAAARAAWREAAPALISSAGWRARLGVPPE